MDVDPGNVSGGGHVNSSVIEREVTPGEPLGPDDDPAHAFLSDGKYLLVGYPDRFLNHSCNPNAYFDYVGAHIFLVSRRAIGLGEEITLDYLVNNAGGDSWECNCGATRCRGVTCRSFFDLPLEVQKEYLPILASWFQRRFADRLAHLETS